MEAPPDTQRTGLVGEIKYKGRDNRKWRIIDVYPSSPTMVWRLKIDGKRVELISPPKGMLRVYVNAQWEAWVEWETLASMAPHESDDASTGPTEDDWEIVTTRYGRLLEAVA